MYDLKVCTNLGQKDDSFARVSYVYTYTYNIHI